MKNSFAFYRRWVSLRTAVAIAMASISIAIGNRDAMGQITKIGEPRPYGKPSAKRPPSPLPEEDLVPMSLPDEERAPEESDARVETTPKGPLLVLKNGNVIFGEIEETGDFYQVQSGKAGKRVDMRFHRAQVEMMCETLTEAYQRRQPIARKGGAENWLKFIAWCVRYKMFDRAQEELDAFSEIHPTSRRVADMRKQIEFQKSEPQDTGPTSPTPVPVDNQLPEEFTGLRLRELPEETMENFNRTVQPLLVRSCGSVRCHGGESKNFLLTYSSMAKGFSSQATQRNLRATLAHIDFRNPDNSPLLNMAIEVHGGSTKAPIVDARDKQFHVLAAWIERLVASHAAQRPATIRPQESTLRQVGASDNDFQPDANQSMDEEIDVSDAPTMESIRGGKKKASRGPFVPKDPFDPEIFNRKHHEK